MDDQGVAKFLRGLTIGALIGAVIAGSRLWAGRGGRRRAPTGAEGEPTRPVGEGTSTATSGVVGRPLATTSSSSPEPDRPTA